MKPKIVVTWPIESAVLEPLQVAYEVVVHPEERVLSEQELLAFVQGASAILCLLTNKITEAVLASAGEQLKIVASMSVGFDHIDVAACGARGVIVTNTPGTLDRAVAEHTIALLLGLAKSLPSADAFVRSGKYQGWDPKLFVGPELGGKVLGIVGLGRIGTMVAQMAGYGLGMAIAYNDIKPNPEFEQKFNATYMDIDALVSVSDVVSLHVPLLPATTHLIHADRLAKMKPTAYVINTSRGPVVDEQALVMALQTKQIAGAALDVYEHEPTIAPALLSLPNVVLTPHTASATVEARRAMAEKAVANIQAVLTGSSPIDPVRV